MAPMLGRGNAVVVMFLKCKLLQKSEPRILRTPQLGILETFGLGKNHPVSRTLICPREEQHPKASGICPWPPPIAGLVAPSPSMAMISAPGAPEDWSLSEPA
ncbi:hypothetical protein AYO22_05377 [Fonsecaea multimorphosa]|nr:hypothetical protein AYO22_05377 [Fonsecaea multimorphosa]